MNFLELRNVGDVDASISLPDRESVKEKHEYQYAYSLGVQAYVYGFPWIYLSQIRWLWTSEKAPALLEKIGAGVQPNAPINSFWRNKRLASPDTAAGGSPNVDTLYSTAWCDIGPEPLVLSVPEIADRYYCIEMVGIDSDTYGYVGTRATGTDAANYLVAGPNWGGSVDYRDDILDVLPRAFYPSILLLCRMGVNDYTKKDLKKALKLQDRYALTPLSEWLGRPVSPEPKEALVPIGFDYNNTLGAWLTMNRAMTENPPGVPPSILQEQLLQLFSRIGVGPNQRLKTQSPVTLLALHDAANDALAMMKKFASRMGSVVNGWNYPSLNTGKAGQDGDYLNRAVIQAMGGITANWPVEGVYLNTYTDSDGKKLTGAEKYTITFEEETFPSFEESCFGFWSLTMYNSSYQLVGGENYTINSWAPEFSGRNASGGMTIYLQSMDPRVNNKKGDYWLQSPDPETDEYNGEFYIILRVYAPSPPISSTQTWTPPAVVRTST